MVTCRDHMEATLIQVLRPQPRTLRSCPPCCVFRGHLPPLSGQRRGQVSERAWRWASAATDHPYGLSQAPCTAGVSALSPVQQGDWAGRCFPTLAACEDSSGTFKTTETRRPQAWLWFQSSPGILLCSQGGEAALGWVTPEVLCGHDSSSLCTIDAKTISQGPSGPVSSCSCPFSAWALGPPSPLSQPSPAFSSPAVRWAGRQPLSLWAPSDRFQ